jgi:hypothetical protein
MSEPVPAANMTAAAGEANVPGLEYGGFDNFNLHLHGWETQPHMFYPLGTSDPKAPWISIEPSGDQKCMCYKLDLAESSSSGDHL